MMSLVSTNSRITECGYIKLVLTEKDIDRAIGIVKNDKAIESPEYRGPVFDVSKDTFNETILNGLIQIVSVRAMAENLDIEKSLEDFSNFLTDYINKSV